MKVETIVVDHQKFLAHPFGALFWEAENIVLIADVHLGKVMHFRKHGSAVPKEALFENFQKLNAVLDCFQPKKLIFLGDLFHSYKNEEWHLFEAWVKEQHELEIILIEGNHDIIPAINFTNIGIQVLENLTLKNFYFTHIPEEKEGFINFCGHVHPVVSLSGLGKQRLKVSCFFKQPHQIILPAFGVFTGGFEVVPTEKDAVYALAGDEVVLLQ